MGEFRSYRNKSWKQQAILWLGPRAEALNLDLYRNPLEGLLEPTGPRPTPEFLIQ